jgi:hypothetical protein
MCYRCAVTTFLTRVVLAGFLLLSLAAREADLEAIAHQMAALIEPAKLATLGKREANPRVEKYVAQLANARVAGFKPEAVAARAVAMAGLSGAAATLTAEAMIRNLTIAGRLGCLDARGCRRCARGTRPRCARVPTPVIP